MPKVGKKKYPYTAEGIAMAKKDAEKRGKPMQTYNSGGRVQKIYDIGGEVVKEKK